MGVFHMPPVELLVAAHLHLWLSAMHYRDSTVLLKADHFQSALAERAYKALVTRALNVSSGHVEHAIFSIPKV